MILPVLACLAVGFQGRMLYLGSKTETGPRSVLVINDARLDPPKLSPRKFSKSAEPWEFDWVSSGLGRLNPSKDKDYDLRFRVFSQLRKPDDDIGILTTRMLMRLWERSTKTYKIDHSARTMQIVDFYLCWGGDPGSQQAFGEDQRPGSQVPRKVRGDQLMDTDVEGDPPQRRAVNTVYVFDIGNLPSRVELAREICHEYGHAILPAIGGFDEPEDWGNGDIGERVFMVFLRDELKKGNLAPIDTMNATLGDFEAWVKRYVDPGILRVAQNGPGLSVIEGKGQDALNAFASLASYVEATLPPAVFSKSLQICGPKASNYGDAILEACKAVGRVVVEIPPVLGNKNLWLPLGKGKLSGGTVVKRAGDWALVKPQVGIIMITFGKS